MKTCFIELHSLTREEKDDLLKFLMDADPKALEGIVTFPYIKKLLKKAKFDFDKKITVRYHLPTLRWRYQQEE